MTALMILVQKIKKQPKRVSRILEYNKKPL